jgi:hypothetical protein
MKNSKFSFNYTVKNLNLNNTAAEYAVNLAIQNADDSHGDDLWVSGEIVNKHNKNDAWYSIADSTLGSIADDWKSYFSLEQYTHQQITGFLKAYKNHAREAYQLIKTENN